MRESELGFVVSQAAVFSAIRAVTTTVPHVSGLSAPMPWSVLNISGGEPLGLHHIIGRTKTLIQRVRAEWAVRILTIARAITIGAAYLAVVGTPGLTSSFVAIFTALLTFDVMVAAPSLRPKHVDYRTLLSRTVRALVQTVASLGKGLIVGIVFGTLTLIGFPVVLGAILTVGLGYSWANRARGSFTSFVGLLGGLAIYEQIRAIEGIDAWISVVGHVAPVAWTVTSGTVGALLRGWVLGIPIGILTRLLLSRPYRWRGSQAYDPPFEVRPFEEVVHAGREYRLFQMRIDPDSPLVGARLSDLRWPDAYQATVVAIERAERSIPLPRGTEEIRPGDALLILCPNREVENLSRLAKPIAKGV